MNTKTSRKEFNEDNKKKIAAFDIMNEHKEKEIVLKMLLDQNISPSQAINAAAYQGSLDICRTLLEQGANVNEVDNLGVVPVQVAATYGDEDKVSLFVSHGAEINPGKQKIDNRYMGHICNPIIMAVSNNHKNIVKYLLDQGCDPNKGTHRDGYSALLYAVKKQNEEIVDLLIEHGIKYSWAKNVIAIPVSSQLGNLSILKKLVEDSKISLTNMKKYKNSLGIQSPLEEAVKNGSLECVSYLLSKGANPNESTSNYKRNSTFTPCLYLALSEGHIHLVDILIAHGAKFRIDPEGREHYAIYFINSMDEEKLIKLVEKTGKKEAIQYINENAKHILSL